MDPTPRNTSFKRTLLKPSDKRKKEVIAKFMERFRNELETLKRPTPLRRQTSSLTLEDVKENLQQQDAWGAAHAKHFASRLDPESLQGQVREIADEYFRGGDKSLVPVADVWNLLTSMLESDWLKLQGLE
jgi:hypothetical protein